MANKTKRMLKRTLSLILALALVLSLGITTAFAAGNGQSITVKKVWNDDNNAYGTRPDSVTVTLQRSGSTPTISIDGIHWESDNDWTSVNDGRKDLTSSSNWQGSWSGLDTTYTIKTPIFGIPVVEAPYFYRVTEVSVEGYTTEVDTAPFRLDNRQLPVTVTIKNTLQEAYKKTGSLTITKAVDGGGTEAADKEYKFTVEGPSYPEGHEVTITGAGSTTLEGLKPGTYTVKEHDANIEGYTLNTTGTGDVTVGRRENNSITITNTYTQQLGNLTIKKEVVGGPADAATTKTYTFTVTGPNNYSTTATVTGNGTATLNDLVPGTYTVTEANADIEGYDLTVTGGGEVTVGAGTTAEVTVTNTYTKNVPDLEITKAVEGGAAKVNVGGIVTYAITVTNKGNADAHNVVVTDTLPEGLTGMGGHDAKYEWTIPVLAAGDKITYSISAIVTAAGSITNSATVDSYETDPATSDCMINATDAGGSGSENGKFTLTVTKEVKGDGADPEQVFTFDVTVNGKTTTKTVKASGSFTVEMVEGDRFTVTEVNIPKGYTVEHGNINGTAPTGSLKVTVINTYTAPKEPEVEYTYSLNYDPNATDVTGMPDPVTEEGSKDPVHVFTVSGVEPTRNGYKFLGWSEDKDSTVADVHSGGEVTAVAVLKPEITLCAIWAKLYTVNFTSNGGSGKMDPMTDVVSGTNITLPENGFIAPAPGNKYFVGWSTEQENGSVLPAGTGYKVKSDVTFYAIWADFIPVTVIFDSDEIVYDGQLHAGTIKGVQVAEGYTVTFNNLKPYFYPAAGGKSYSVRNVGTYTVYGADGSITVLDKNGNDVSDKCEVKFEKGTLTITPAPVTITVDKAEKFYGEKDPEFTGKVDGVVSDDDLNALSVKYFRTNKEEGVGTYQQVLTATYDENDNYTVTVNNGNFEIKTASITGARVEAAGGSWVYDGNEHAAAANVLEADGYTVEYSLDGTNWTTTAPSVTNVSDGTLTVRVRAVREGYETLTCEQPVTLTITRKPVTVTANNASKVQGATDPAFSATVEGLLGDDTIAYTVSRTDAADNSVGTHNTITPSGETEQGNYAVTYVSGTLTITAAPTVIPDEPYTPPVDIPDENPPLAEQPGDPPLTDIDDENVPLAGAIGLNTTDHFNYLMGTPEGAVLPNASLTRAEAAAMFFRLMTDDFRAMYWTNQNDFSDVADTAWFNSAVSTSANAGKLLGQPDGTYQPNRAITRAEFATIAVRFMEEDYNIDVVVGDFSDTVGHWASENIRRAVQAGWITGDPGGTFRPDDPITRAEAVAIINRMLDRVPTEEGLLEGMKTFTDNMDPTAWYYLDIQEAANYHDYERDGDLGITETWIDLNGNVDWTLLEKEWEANGGRINPPADENTDKAPVENTTEDNQ